MPNHTIEQGECLQKIAQNHGIPRPLDIWNHPNNAALRKKRKDNPNVLFPGDVLFIPDKQEKTVTKPANAVHTFKIPSIGKKLHIVVRDAKDEPLAGKDYELTVYGKTYKGKTDGAGAVNEVVPAEATAGKLAVDGYMWNIAIGNLNPILHTEDEGVTGVQARLRNLGYLGDHAPGIPCEKTRDATRRFQRDHDLPQTGKVDQPTSQKIEAAHKDEVRPTPPQPTAGAKNQFTVRVVDALPETPSLCTARSSKKKKKQDPHPVAPTVTNVLAPARKGKCGLCSKEVDCVDNDYDFLLAVAQMATRLRGDAGAFVGIMHFETGHTYSSKIQNNIGATGLIQFLKGTAEGLGTTTDQLKAMCRIEQLGWVEKYFENQKKSYPQADYSTVRDVVLAVFEPIGLNPSHDVLGVSATECEGPFVEGKGKKAKTYWTATFRGQTIRVSKHQRAVYQYNGGLDRDKDGFIVRDDYPAIVNNLLATCAKDVAAKARELQQTISGAPEYKILKPGAEPKPAAKAS